MKPTLTLFTLLSVSLNVPHASDKTQFFYSGRELRLDFEQGESELVNG